MNPSAENIDQAAAAGPPAANEVAVLREQLNRQSSEMESVKSQLSEMTELLRRMVSQPTPGQTPEEAQRPPVARPTMATAPVTADPGPNIPASIASPMMVIAPPVMATTLNAASRQEASAPIPVKIPTLEPGRATKEVWRAPVPRRLRAHV